MQLNPTSNISAGGGSRKAGQHPTSNVHGRKYDLEQRLLNYSVEIMALAENLHPGMASNHIGNQMLRSGTSPFFNHGEAQAAESTKDFVHKMKICLKELRETRRALLLVKTKPLTLQIELVESLIQETEQLIRIFFCSIRTARTNMVREDAGEYEMACSAIEC